MKAARALSAAFAVAALALSACGGSEGKNQPRIAVAAASSLDEALTSCSPGFSQARVRLSFAGSDQLAAQIRQGAKPDVYAAANTKLPRQLSAEGRLTKPIVFATNQLVIAVPAGAGKVRSIGDLAKPSLKLAVGSDAVPVGSYTQQTLARLPALERRQILHNVRSREPDVKGIVGKLTQRAVDAGFVYVTDVRATRGKLVAIVLPSRLRPAVGYGAGIVKGTNHPAAARDYVQGLLTGTCAESLRKAGFGPPSGLS
jgi:molybdate transport system substrate-binding protein